MAGAANASDLIAEGAATAAAATVAGPADGAGGGLAALLSGIGFDLPAPGAEAPDADDIVPLVGGTVLALLVLLLGAAIGFLLFNFLLFSIMSTTTNTMTSRSRAITLIIVMKIQLLTNII